MNRPTLSHAGRRLLDRRDFLRCGGTGLGGIALASLLAEQRLLAAERADPPADRSRASARAARRRTFTPKAKRVLIDLLLRRAAATSTRGTTSRS